MRIRPMAFVARTGVAVLLLAGTAGVGVTTPAFAASKTDKLEVAAKKSVKISIKNFAFKPSKVSAKVGQKIVVTNNDSTAHTFTANKGAFNTGDINPGKTKTVTVKKAGSYPFHCSIHTFMKGTLTMKK